MLKTIGMLFWSAEFISFFAVALASDSERISIVFRITDDPNENEHLIP
jgi:hypothetical protein